MPDEPILTAEEQEQKDARERSELYPLVLARMNITWDLDYATQLNIESAMEEAVSYLREVAGNPSLSFKKGYLRTLFVDCSWYIFEHKRADFRREYSEELTALRLKEGHGCG